MQLYPVLNVLINRHKVHRTLNFVYPQCYIYTRDLNTHEGYHIRRVWATK